MASDLNTYIILPTMSTFPLPFLSPFLRHSPSGVVPPIDNSSSAFVPPPFLSVEGQAAAGQQTALTRPPPFK